MLFSLIELAVLFGVVAIAFGGIVAYFLYKTREEVDTKTESKDKKGAGRRR